MKILKKNYNKDINSSIYTISFIVGIYTLNFYNQNLFISVVFLLLRRCQTLITFLLVSKIFNPCNYFYKGYKVGENN